MVDLRGLVQVPTVVADARDRLADRATTGLADAIARGRHDSSTGLGLLVVITVNYADCSRRGSATSATVASFPMLADVEGGVVRHRRAREKAKANMANPVPGLRRGRPGRRVVEERRIARHDPRPSARKSARRAKPYGFLVQSRRAPSRRE